MSNEFKKGFTDPVGDCGKFEASIDVGAWGARIAVFGDTPADAEQLRDVVFAAITAPQPPALGGEHQSKLLKLAANLANRRPLRPLHDLCERQSSIKTSRLIEYVEMCGDTLAAIALDIRNHTDACRAPLLAEIASERELRRELGVRVHQLKDELKDVAQLKADLAERWEQIAELNSEIVKLKARNDELKIHLACRDEDMKSVGLEFDGLVQLLRCALPFVQARCKETDYGDASARTTLDGIQSVLKRLYPPVQAGSECCTPTDEERALLAAGDCTPEELWGGPRPTCPKCIKPAGSEQV
ncbi:hypothetical protein V2J81_23220 [Pseudomonas alliivorans]|nr:hypothetical protein [Pseudomonas alliivorans]